MDHPWMTRNTTHLNKINGSTYLRLKPVKITIPIQNKKNERLFS